MNLTYQRIAATAALVFSAGSAMATATPEEAAQLKTTLTPFGSERAGNKEGTIPAWTGAPTPGADIVNGRRGDPFANEKPLYSVTAKNLDQYADKVSEGFKAIMKKYPASFRMDVYPSHRTAIAPQWVYDNTAKNAVNAKLVEGAGGQMPEGAYGGIPFPIPKSGAEVAWNHLLRWRGVSSSNHVRNYQVTADGQWLMIGESHFDIQMPYYMQGEADKFKGEYWMVTTKTLGPAIRVGEAIIGRLTLDDDKSQSWVYLPGQRRVRKLPNPCCDTPTPFTAGISTFDEINVFTGRTGRFDWKIVGKKEMLIPYNGNRYFTPLKDSDMFGPKHLNPDSLRWELHRVWVVDATLRNGQRHTSPKNRYYFDEDTWNAVMAERYDASGALTRVPFAVPVVITEGQTTEQTLWGIYDLVGGSTFIAGFYNERTTPYKIVQKPWKESLFTPDVMAGEGVR
ncbi:DUF1329 domain-containing protein [Duganella sp. FT135W]|uniref:DUF1329 domain-containing protein n=1 Tax=Duganella flavida TaxID=2692175 RepID=A0A6L8KGP7_9BURK|nr:DUF1329 domain-containing protein [Duganella flavida]MYM26285.1 DUF1329 domain-containing protein [Duganella flavida]